MAEEFQVEFFNSGNWWNSPRNVFGSSPCSSAINDFWWTSCNEMILEDKSAAVSSSPGGGLQKNTDAGSTHHQTSNQWNQNLLNESRFIYSPILQEINNQPFYSSTINDQQLFSNCQLDPSSSIDSSSYNCGLLRGLFEDSDSQIPEPVLDDQEMNFYRNEMNLPFYTSSMAIKKSKPDDNLPLWNSEATNLGCVQSAKSQFVPMISNIDLDISNKNLTGDSVFATVKKTNCNQSSLKRPRMETPSPLPTFKVRKEKLGDRITALQQLVSPFGKTDTASVLHEAIDYIKFLHDQVNALTSPYMKMGIHQLKHQQQLNEEDGLKQDLRGRGLCLMPISVTFPETTSDFWRKF